MPPHRHIVVLEPTWEGQVHLPGNLGLMQTLHAAFPGAPLHFVGDASQIALMAGNGALAAMAPVQFHPWTARQEAQTGLRDVRERMHTLRALPAEVLAHGRFVMTSISASCVQAVNRLGLASRSAGILHGNAGELFGWRSRNPWFRQFDFVAGVDRFVARGGRLVVLEERIRRRIGQQAPGLAPSLLVWPHPLIAAEAAPGEAPVRAPGPVRVGFAGLATVEKGFPEFLALAAALKGGAQDGTGFEFHAFGKLSPPCAGLDQSLLRSQAGARLSRDEFLAGLRSMDFLFVWHHDSYYGLAASGVVYDAVSQLLPILGNRAGQQAEWLGQGLDVGVLRHETHELADELKRQGAQLVAEPVRRQQRAALLKIRESLSLHELAGHTRRSWPWA